MAWVTWPKFEILGPPHKFWMIRVIRLKCAIDIENGPSLCMDHKTTPKWACLGSRVLISKFLDPLISFERIGQFASNLVQWWKTDTSSVRNIKWPRSGCGLGYVTQFRNFGTTLITFERIEQFRFKFGTDIEDGPILRPDHKTPLSGCGLGHVTKFRNFGTPLITLERIEISASNLAQT